MVFTAKIKEYRPHLHITQENLAKLVGVRCKPLFYREKQKSCT